MNCPVCETARREPYSDCDICRGCGYQEIYDNPFGDPLYLEEYRAQFQEWEHRGISWQVGINEQIGKVSPLGETKEQ